MLSEALETCNDFYPGVIDPIRRLSPTYPQHPGRRSEELQELEQTVVQKGLTPHVTPGVREGVARLAKVSRVRRRKPKQWTIHEIIDEIQRARVLHAPARETG